MLLQRKRDEKNFTVRYYRCAERLCHTFHRKQAFLRGITIGWDLAWFHYAYNDVFARLRLVISRRFRLVSNLWCGLRVRGLAQRARTTANGRDTALQFATRTPWIPSPGKTRQKSRYLREVDEKYLLIATSLSTSRSHQPNFINVRRKPRRSRLAYDLFRRSAKCFHVAKARRRTSWYSTMSRTEDAVRDAPFAAEASFPCVALSTFSSAEIVARTRTTKWRAPM